MSSLIRSKNALASLLLALALWGCDSHTPKIDAIDRQAKTLACVLNGSPMQIVIHKDSLVASLLYEGKEIRIDLLEVKDFYQILMRFDPQIGQLKINKMGNELIQLKSGNEQITTCSIQLN